MNYIENNPYRILGVLSNSSMKEIVSNFGKIKAFAKTGKSVSFNNDFIQLLGPINRDSQLATDAYNAISLPKDRFVAGLFWFIQDSPIDEVAINKLRAGDIQGAITLLRKKVTVSACVNLAIIHLIEKKWTTALYYYTYLLNSEERRQQLLSIITDNESLLSEKDIVEYFVEKLISSFPDVGWVESIHQHEVTIEDKTYNIENFFGDSNVYECLIKKGNDKLFKLIRNSINKANSTPKTDAKANLKAAKLLEKDAKFVLRSLRLSLGKDNKEYISLCDQVANVILDRCIDYYNHDQNNPRRPKNIIQLLRFAMRTAESKIPKDRCRKNYDQIKSECDKLLPEEIESEVSYIKKQIEEFNKLNSFSNYSGYLNATIGICYQKMESIKTKVGPESLHYVNTSSDVVCFAIKVIQKEIDSKHKAYASSMNDDLALTNLKNALEWGKPIYQTLESFPKNTNCSDLYNKQKTSFFRIYEDILNHGCDKRKVSEEKKVEINLPDKIEVGKPFTLSYSLEDTLRNCRFIEPPIQYLDIIKGPTESVFSKPCIIEHNGQIISGCGPVCTEYSYILKARWAGTFKIPPASIVVKGEVYKSSEAIIKVVESGRSLDQDSNANKSSSGNNYNNKNNFHSSKKPTNSSDAGNSKFSKTLFIILGFLAIGLLIFSIANSSITKPKDVPSYSTSLQDSSVNKFDGDDNVNEVQQKHEANKEPELEPAPEPEPQYEIVYFKTGDRPYQSFYGRGRYDNNTQNSLRINNGSSCDAVVFLESLNGKKARHVYIRKDETFTMTQIPGGKYIIKIMHGNSWNPDKYNGDNAPKGGFMEDVSMSKSESYDPFDYPYPESGGYYEYEVKLYKVVNGNMQTETISPSEMF